MGEDEGGRRKKKNDGTFGSRVCELVFFVFNIKTPSEPPPPYFSSTFFFIYYFGADSSSYIHTIPYSVYHCHIYTYTCRTHGTISPKYV